jgi:hypothetical protein
MFNIFTLFDGPIGDDNESDARVVGAKWWVKCQVVVYCVNFASTWLIS